MSDSPIPIDVLIFGGGVAGLWLLDKLRRQNYSTLLAESTAFGHGQTVCSQGIIHGGLKYMFGGNLNPAARIISEMPALWRDCLAGRQYPDLTGTTILSDGGYIWGTGSIMSRIFITGSTLALRTKPTPVDPADYPAVLKHVPGKVLRVGEQVIDPVSMTRRLAAQNPNRLLHINPSQVEFTRSATQFTTVRLHPEPGTRNPEPDPLLFAPTTIILTAGQGNAMLREQAGLSTNVMQRRPLHMVMVRGPLPLLFGHCVGGPKPRITVTTSANSAGQPVWQVGGQIAEDGVHKDPSELMAFAKNELLACLPRLDLSQAQFATYRIDRAEAATTTGQKPDDAHIIRDDNLLTAFPTKLALAPRLATRILAMLPRPRTLDPGPCLVFPIPPLAQPPWEDAQWHTVP